MIKNIFFLFLVQVSNYVFPLLTLPFLMRTLGVENFGVMAMVMACVQYSIIIVDYGFNFSATRLIAINKSNRNEINNIYTITTTAKLILLLIMYILLLIYTLLSDFSIFSYYLLLGSLSVIGTVFFPIWLFQGLEKMQGIAFSSTIAKLLAFPLVFILVEHNNDVDMAIISQSIGSILCALISVLYIKYSALAQFKKVSIKSIFDSYKSGFDLFISNVTIGFYTTLNVIIIGYFGGVTLAGYFSAADKIRSAVQGIFGPVQQAIFPRACTLIDGGMDLTSMLKMYGNKFIVFSLFVTLGLAVVGYPVSLWYYGESYRVSSMMLITMSPLPFIVGISVVYGQWWLVNIKKTALIRKTYVCASIFHIIFSISLMYYIPTYGVIISVLITEVIITIVFVKNAFRYKRQS